MKGFEGLLGNPMFQAGMGILSANAPSLTPPNYMGGAMKGLMQGAQYAQQQKEMEMKKKLYDLQLQEAEDKRAREQQRLEALSGFHKPDPNAPQMLKSSAAQLYTTGNPMIDELMASGQTDLGFKLMELNKPEKGSALMQNFNFYRNKFPNKSDEEIAQMAKSGQVINLGDKINPLDEPYSVTESREFVDKHGNPPAGVVTPRMVISGKYKLSTKGMSAESASKTQMLETARRAYKGSQEEGLPGAKDLIYDESGNVNRKTLFAANAKIPGQLSAAGKQLSTIMNYGIQAITRTETGAAMPPSEVSNTKSRFMPSFLDDDKTIQIKLAMYEDFLDGSIKLLKPKSAWSNENEAEFDSEAFELELQKRLAKTKVKEKKLVEDMSLDEAMNAVNSMKGNGEE